METFVTMMEAVINSENDNEQKKLEIQVWKALIRVL